MCTRVGFGVGSAQREESPKSWKSLHAHCTANLKVSTDMKIALFGATGRTGKEFINIAKKHSITALSRSGSTLDNAAVIMGDGLNANDVDLIVKDADVVVSVVGHVKDSPPDLQTRITKNIIAAMKKYGITRFVSLSGMAVDYEKDVPGFSNKVIKFMMNIIAKDVLSDAVAHTKLLQESDLDFTVVRAPRLTDGPATEYKVGYVGVNATAMSVSRASVAQFILKCIEDGTYIRDMPAITA